MVDSTLILISPSTRYQDTDGQWRTSKETQREVFAQAQSVSRNEFFAGGQSGLRPELQLTVFQGEYQGEAEAIYNGVRYAIYRTYRVPGTDYMELYLQREVGVHG